MTIHIGRVQLVEHDPVLRVSDDGSAVSLSGHTGAVERLRGEWTRQQLLGYVNSPDEPFVPFTWDVQPELSGFYRVVSASFNGSRVLGFRGLWDFSVELERVTGFAAPLVELRGLGAARSPSPTTEYPLIVVPDAARSVAFWSEDLEAWIPFFPDGVLEGASGDVKVYNLAGYVTQFYVPPESFYDGASTLMMGDDLNVVVGRQVSSTPGAWRLSNGVYEIEPTGSEQFELQHRVWVDGDWSDWVPFMFWASVQDDPFEREPMPAPHTIVVLRNSPTEVAVRLLVTAVNNYSPVTFDLSLKRGALGVGVELRSVFESNFAIQAASVSWSQPDTWRVQADSDGVRHFVGSNQAVSLIGGGGIIPYEGAISFVDRWSFILGATRTSLGASGPFAAFQQCRAWLHAGSEKQSVVVQ